MSDAPSQNVRLYGTEEPPAQARVVEAGLLSALLQDGALRCVRLGGREAIRGIAFIVRDENWGTYAPEITNLDVAATDKGFRIRYDASCGSGRQVLDYSATISGSADGSLAFEVTGAARSPFLTSRTGFVVLHPIEGVAGTPGTVTHTDGSVESIEFPRRIQPSQPVHDIRALTHEVHPGLRVTCTMEGDAFEMEDQRNWSDASFKTYIRPLAKPHPYTLEPGRTFVQRVTLAVQGDPPRRVGGPDGDVVAVSVGRAEAGAMPALALALDPAYSLATPSAVRLMRQGDIRWLVCSFDPAAGDDADTMAIFRQAGEATGARLILEATLPLQDAGGAPADDAAVLAADVESIRRGAETAGVDFAVVSGLPACYYKSYQPSGPWPKAPPLRDVYAALRDAFPNAQIAGGMHGYFTEFNRCPPPVDALDIVIHSTCPIVHAADDRSVMETLEALPWIFDSVRALAGAKPYWIGPTAIGMRFNPYGAAVAPNPHNRRIAMAAVDPRQRGLFNAAWTLGYVARAAAAGVSGVCLSAVAGPRGICWHPAEWAQPWFDDRAAATAVFPVYPVIAGLARRAGAAVLPVEVADPSALAALAVAVDGKTELWLANLTATRRTATLTGIAPHSVERLDAATFVTCCAGPDGFSSTRRALHSAAIELDAYAVVRITGGT